MNNITIVGVESVDGGTNPQMSTSDEEIRDRLERLKVYSFDNCLKSNCAEFYLCNILTVSCFSWLTSKSSSHSSLTFVRTVSSVR